MIAPALAYFFGACACVCEVLLGFVASCSSVLSSPSSPSESEDETSSASALPGRYRGALTGLAVIPLGGILAVMIVVMTMGRRTKGKIKLEVCCRGFGMWL